MNFAELYTNNRRAVERFLRKTWTGPTANDSQKAYKKQLEAIIEDIFAPKTAMPLVQCMNLYESVRPEDAEFAMSLVGDIWKKCGPRDKEGNIIPPFEHQYQSWLTLLREKSPEGNPMSIVVTTGTGSGKTECFMMPLVQDLIEYNKEKAGEGNRLEEVQAIFLYPLNALMEDQKERLEKMLEGTSLMYSVYNGDLPEKEPDDDDFSEDAERARKRIDAVAGPLKNGERKYKHMLYTREQVRKTPPNILLTNATMLEYMLLRDSDRKLTDADKKSLRWISIDETHTYTGAGAAELAMLLRRVILAYGVNAQDIRFATSSATFGNASTPEEIEIETLKLRNFIANLTGLGVDQVRAIGGKRIGEEKLSKDHEDYKRWEMICHNDYVKLSDIFPNGSIPKKLEALNQMCARAEQIDKVPMKLKVHYFYRVPNNGLFVALTQVDDGAFKIETSINPDVKTEAPRLELCRCTHCGEYVAVARRSKTTGIYEALVPDDSDMFDLNEDPAADEDMKYIILGLSQENPSMEDGNEGNGAFIAEGNVLTSATEGCFRPKEWRIIGNTQCRCPYCNSKQGKNQVEVDEETGDLENSRLKKFRINADTISRLIAPTILDQIEEYKPKGNPEIIPIHDGKQCFLKSKDGSMQLIFHKGQQYLSFVDSRQAAAIASLKQNVEEERLWFYSIVYKALNEKARNTEDNSEEIEWKESQLATAPEKYRARIQAEIDELKSRQGKDYMTWKEIAELVMNDPLCPTFCLLFAKRNDSSAELDEEGKVKPKVLWQYVNTMMIEYLAYRPAKAAAPETMGLFHSYYPGLEEIELPESVMALNDSFIKEESRISVNDWRNYLQLFLDYKVRVNQSFFIKVEDEKLKFGAEMIDNMPIDIFTSVRFASEHPRRRPTKELTGNSRDRFTQLLYGLIRADKGQVSAEDKELAYNVLLSVTVQLKKIGLLERGQHLNEKTGYWVFDNSEDAMRFNVANLGFKVYNDVYLCDTNSARGRRHTTTLRPIATWFKSFAPYLSEGVVTLLDKNLHEHWTPAPDKFESIETLTDWAKENRKLLWNHGLWGEDGEFADRLDMIHMTPDLFIQAEHTAQVDKAVSRQLQTDFKNHEVNILACSTTMEMGVNLGDLEVVMLTSVPPQPSNYKQRAGRSGRNNLVRSVCITLCGSDLIGLRTLTNPLEKIINRQVAVPTVDLKSEQVVQRHVNSFLIRYFGVFGAGKESGKLSQRVFNYYSDFHWGQFNGHRDVLTTSDSPVSLGMASPLGDVDNTLYKAFDIACSQEISEDLKAKLTQLIANTVFNDDCEKVVKTARKENVRCYKELLALIQEYKGAFDQEMLKPKDKQSQGFKNLLHMRYREALQKRLLEFWATSRFTPNANMPVDVLSLDISDIKDKHHHLTNESNPSYSLRQALSQYVPGNPVTVDGVVYTVRGVQLSKLNDDPQAFKHVSTDGIRTIIDHEDTLGTRKTWKVNNKDVVELIQPKGFLPDINETNTRILGDGQYTHVSAQLIDTDKWPEEVNPETPSHLFSVRTNRDTMNAKILYYNEGIGFGYCVCSCCGRAVMETEAAPLVKPQLPELMNNRIPPVPEDPDEKQKPPYHFAINGSELHKKCFGSNQPGKIRRNVIIGNLIQTDYSEIKFRHPNMERWISDYDKEKDMLYTLGIVFAQALVDILGKDRGAVDFTVMPNGHICIFDTNPGGAGYSNQLSKVHLMKEVIAASKKLLQEAKDNHSKDLLLDKFTIRYLNHINIDAALKWIEEEDEACAEIPDEITSLFAGSVPTVSNLSDLENAVQRTSSKMTIFVNDDFTNWKYGDSKGGWRGHLQSFFLAKGDDVTFCITGDNHALLSEGVKKTCRSIVEWSAGITQIKNPYASANIYPVAYVDGNLYFTNHSSKANLNESWGSGELFCVRTDNPAEGATAVDCDYKKNKDSFRLNPSERFAYTSKGLGEVIYARSKDIIDQFIAHCKNSPDKVINVKYQDKHLKSVLGIVITIQVINYLVKKIGKDFDLYLDFEKFDIGHSSNSIVGSFGDSKARDDHFELLAEPWLDALEESDGIIGNIVELKSHDERELVHWRELSIECNGKTLGILPNGGFANGWLIGYPTTKRYEIYNTDTSDNIPLRLSQTIRYDVEIE